MRFMGRGPMSSEETEAVLGTWERHWRDHCFGLLAATDRTSGELIGRSGAQFHRAWPDDPEVGWGFDPEWWGRGLATEAGQACVDWMFGSFAFERLVSITTAENLASRRVMAKLGFVHDATIPFPELAIELMVHARSRPA
jgi:RimJ/RimL family protein N-acetyltransferase